MRVVEVTVKYPPAFGGHEKYVQDMAEGLAARGVDTLVLTSNLRSHRTGEVLPASSAAGEPPSRVRVVRLPAEEPLTRRVALPGLKQELARLRPDVIHAHDVWRHPTEVAMEAAGELGVPFILNPCFHDRSAEPSAGHWASELARVVGKIPRGSRLLFNTRWEKERLEELGFAFERTGYLPPSVDLDEIDRMPREEIPGLPPERIALVFVGRFAPEKGIDLLLRSFAAVRRHFLASDRERARRLHLVLAGFRDTNDDFESVAEQCGVRAQTTFLYDLPRRAVVNLMRRADLFVFPSRAETFGIVIIEAWATGNVVVTSDRTALPYVVTHGRDGLACPDGELVETIIAAIARRDTDWARGLAAAGRRTVERLYTRERQIDALEGFVREAVAEKKAETSI